MRTPLPSPRPALWDIDTLDPELAERSYLDVATFVEGLRRDDIDVPSCWYFHGWVVKRLLALRHWYLEVRLPGTTPRSVAEWWSIGLQPLLRDWDALFGHHGLHPPAGTPWGDPLPTPSLATVVAERLQACTDDGASA